MLLLYRYLCTSFCVYVCIVISACMRVCACVHTHVWVCVWVCSQAAKVIHWTLTNLVYVNSYVTLEHRGSSAAPQRCHWLEPSHGWLQKWFRACQCQSPVTLGRTGWWVACRHGAGEDNPACFFGFYNVTAELLLPFFHFWGSGDRSVVRMPDSWLKVLGSSLCWNGGRISSPGSACCADSHFGICSTPVLLQ